MPDRTRTGVLLLARVALACAAFWALRRELAGVSLDGMLQQVRTVGPERLLAGIVATAASFLLLGWIEILAVRHTHVATPPRVPPGVAILTGFVANAFSQSIGLALLTGTAVRARAYARYHLGPLAIAQVSAFVTLSATIGLLAAGAVAMLTSTAQLTVGHATLATGAAGAALAALVLAYVAWAALGTGSGIGIGRYQLPRPSLGLAMAQVALSTLDWMAAGAVLLAFLPDGGTASAGTLLGAFMIAQVIGVASHMPGGVGVFDAILLSLLAHGASASTRAGIAVALLLYRTIYYILPLVLAMLVAGISEMRRRRSSARAVQQVHPGVQHAG